LGLNHTLPPGALANVSSTPTGGINTGIISAAADRIVARTHASLFKETPNIDLHAELERAFACVGLDEGQRPCREVRVIDPASDEPLLPVEKGVGQLPWIAVTLNFMSYQTLFAAQVHLNFWTTDSEVAPQQQLIVYYEEYAPAGIDEAPWYKDPDDVSESDVRRHAAAREYWLSGTPSKLESTVLAAIADVAAITSNLLSTADAGQIPDVEAWIESWPEASELAAQGLRECSGRRCRVRYVKTTPERDWIVDTTFGLMMEVVRSARPEFAQRSQRASAGSAE
jgi:hypothetical protein